MKDRAIGQIAQIMLRQFGASDTLVGTLVGSVPSGIGLILGPIVSVKSDRYRSRWGRRIPFILIPTPFVMLLMFILAMTPEMGNGLKRLLGEHGPSAVACKILVFSIAWAAFDIGSVVVGSLYSALINDVVPQAVIGRFFGLFRLVSLFVGAVFSEWLLAKANDHFRLLLVVLGASYGIGFMLMCLKVKEGDYPPPPPLGDARNSRLAAVIAYFRECLTHRFFLWYFIATTLGNIAIAPFNTFSLFHARSVAEAAGRAASTGDQLYGSAAALSYVISMALSYPLGVLADRIHPLRMGLITILLYAAATAYGFAFGVTPATFFVAVVLHTVISGCFYTGTASISQRLLPRQKYAEINSAGGMIQGICFFVLPPILGMVVEHTHHNYRFVFALGSVLALISAVAFMFLLKWYYRLGGDEGFMPPESAPQIEGVPPVQADPREQ